MTPVFYQNQQLRFGSSAKTLEEFISTYSRPTYIYDLSDVSTQFESLHKEVPKGRIFYALKANHHPEVLRTLHQKNCGLDIVSGGELNYGLQQGFSPQNMIFSGVGKKVSEIELALSVGLYQINVESVEELQKIARTHQSLKTQKGFHLGPAPIVLRLNPHIAIESHPYISTGLNENKFGIPEEDLAKALDVFNSNKDHLNLVGLSLHLGSQMTQVGPIEAGVQKIVIVFKELQKTFPNLKRLDLGGGLGIDYQNRNPEFESQLLKSYGGVLNGAIEELSMDPDFELQLEPGRWIVGHSGILITQVQYVKKTKFKNFVIVDTGMHHLMRPALYQAYHQVLPLIKNPGPEIICDIVGPICESSDFLAKNRSLSPVNEGDFLAILDVGAYGAVLANNYNLQGLPAEMVL